MSRWVGFLACALLGAAMLICGLLVPAHLRAVDASIIQAAGRNTPGVVGQAQALLSENQFGAAQLLAQVTSSEAFPDREKLNLAVASAVATHPDWLVWGGGDYHLQVLFATDPKLPKSGPESFTEWVIRLENRGTVLQLLQASTRPAVQELLRTRVLTNTAIFSPSASASGQALDAALSTCGLLLEENKLTPALSNTLYTAAAQANQGGSTLPLENLLLDFMALGQRFNWSQLALFVNQVQDTDTLRRLTTLARHADGHLPVLFTAVLMSGRPTDVANYLMTYSQTGPRDLAHSLQFGAGGLNELLNRGQRLVVSGFARQLGVDYCWHEPALAMTVKWLLYLVGGFLAAAALHFARRVPVLERPLQVRGFHVVREILFALGFLAVVLLLSEPFLAQESQKVEFPPRLTLSALGSAISAGSNNVRTSIMNQVSLLTLLLFFVLQGLIYTACVVKLAEIRRQKVAPRVKLKLLENEDHLFDAGLYLGFVGTIISLILVSLGVIKFSLMAAYSSTSFGIIFVSFFKIFHLRPVRRKLLLEAESAGPEPAAPVTARLAAVS